MGTQIDTRKPGVVEALVDNRESYVSRSLSPKINSQRFMLAAKRELNGNWFNADQLHAAKESVEQAMLTAAAFGLIPGVHCHFVPYGGKEPKVQMLPNYKGVIHRANTSARLKMHAPVAVFKGDKFMAPSRRVENGKYSVSFFHEPTFQTEELIATYVAYEMDGSADVSWCPASYINRVRDDILSRNEAKAKRSGRTYYREQEPWVKHYVEMAKKTAVHHCAKYLAWDDGFDAEVNLGEAAAHEIGGPVDMGEAVVVEQPSSKTKTPEVVEDAPKPKRVRKKAKAKAESEDPPAPATPEPDESAEETQEDFDDGDFGGSPEADGEDDFNV